MPVRVTFRYLLAFAALVLVSSELHEQAHITVGRLVCGCYGPRDFNVWTTGTPCANPSLTVLASIAGPIFSYSLMATGVWLLARGEDARRAVGWALVFAPLNSTTHALAAHFATEALTAWEPRIDVLRVRAAARDAVSGVLDITIDYRVRSTNSEFNLVYPFYLRERGRDGATT